MKKLWPSLLIAFGLLTAAPTQAARPAKPRPAPEVSEFLPQGETAKVRQVMVQFSAPMVAFGDPRAPAPFEASCAVTGQSRWIDTTHWVYDFERDLPPGIACSFAPRPGLLSLDGRPVQSRPTYAFHTGGPKIIRSTPWAGSNNLREEQVLLLRLNAAVDRASVASLARCIVDAGERKVLLLDENEAKRLRTIYGDTYQDPNEPPPSYLALRCEGRLETGKPLQLKWSSGIRSEGGVASAQDQVLNFAVRGPLSYRTSCNNVCEYESGISINFSAPITREKAEAVSLTLADGSPGKRQALPVNQKYVSSVSFAGPFEPLTKLRLDLPQDIRDDDNRLLGNGSAIRDNLLVGDMPPNLVFHRNFSIVERNWSRKVPLMVQNIESRFSLAFLAIDTSTDERLLDGLRRYYSRFGGAKGEYRLHDQPGMTYIDMERGQPEKTREMMQFDLPRRGLYFFEPRSERLRSARATGGYIPLQGAFITNIAVHLRSSPSSSLVWVTFLDSGLPVEGAKVAISQCDGKVLWRGITDKDGKTLVNQELAEGGQNCPSELNTLLVTARLGDDLGFTLKHWQHQSTFNGVNSYGRGYSERPATIAHTVFDRQLFRAGETVHMRHYYRDEVLSGLEIGNYDTKESKKYIRFLQAKMVITDSAGRSYAVPFDIGADGSATTEWTIPADAPLGTYHVELYRANDWQHRGAIERTEFRVEEFRLPTMKAELKPPAGDLIAPAALPIELNLSYLSGGGVSQKVHIRAASQASYARFPGFEAYRFQYRPPEPRQYTPKEPLKKVVDKLPVDLDRDGHGQATINLPPVTVPTDLMVEMEFADANGETQTTGRTLRLWPSAVLLGIKSSYWASAGTPLDAEVLALSPAGERLPGIRVRIDGKLTRYRNEQVHVGNGVYRSELKSETEELADLCQGVTDERGILRCKMPLNRGGSLALSARAADAQGRPALVQQSLWVADGNTFNPEDTNNLRLLSDKQEYAPGEVARLQVRLPFAPATALVTIEREGLLESSVRHFDKLVNEIEVPILGSYAPNMYISVMALHGRHRDNGPSRDRKRPDWDKHFLEVRVDDPGAPGMASGTAGIAVRNDAYRLKVTVDTERNVYRNREKARARIQVRDADGKPPAPGTTIQVAVVDEALLQLKDNPSWDLLAAMWRKRANLVSGSSGLRQILPQLEVPPDLASSTIRFDMVARYMGAVAAPAPEPMSMLAARMAGNPSPDNAVAVREFFDTLLLWQTVTVTDTGGNAEMEVPLNDSLSRFRIVAIASNGADRFGTGETSVRTDKPLQIVAGLPPLLREGDSFRAGVTLRNTGAKSLRVRLVARPTSLLRGEQKVLPEHAQVVSLAGGEDRDLAWTFTVPGGAERLDWLLTAEDTEAGEQDALKLSQKVVPAVPVTVQQATLAQVTGRYSLPVALPKDAIVGRGEVAVTIAPSLVGGLEGVRRFANDYPYSCMEQQVSTAVILEDASRWQRIERNLSAYLDGRGFVKYWPEVSSGSMVLTAYVVVMSAESRRPMQYAVHEQMIQALAGYVSGTVREDWAWAPRNDLLVRKLIALNALSYTHHFQAKWLQDLRIDPNALPTSALLDWLGILQRRPDVADRPRLIDQAQRLVRSRMDLHGTTFNFSTERDDNWWWIMGSPDTNALRALRMGPEIQAWQDSLPRMARGAILRQNHGAWSTTVANAWGALAIRRFATTFEKEPVAGTSSAALAEVQKSIQWPKPDAARREALPARTLELPWPVSSSGTSLTVTQQGTGRPWVMVQSRAAVPPKAPFWSGYRIKKTVEVIERKRNGVLSKGDVLRVRLEMDAQSDITWVALSDPIPAGATILSRGLARDSQLQTRGETRSGSAWLARQESTFEAFRAYYQFVPKGKWRIDYTVRLNNEGEFNLPQTRIEAMYAPEIFGELPNKSISVQP
jgi:uncharacterized protein YfaS (alpha-2-macroglobulin family)